MSVSVFVLCALAHGVALVAALGSAAMLHRRLRGARLVRAVIIATGVVLIPANVIAAMHDGGSSAVSGSPAATIAVVDLLAAIGIVSLVVSRWIGPRPADQARRVLAIGAHPDDVELACGGTLAKLADSGHEVRALVMSDGSGGGDGATRRAEAISSGLFLGAVAVEVHDFTDTRLADHANDMVATIERAVRRFNPDIIFTHSSNDQHQDHQAVHLATIRAARSHPAILCYESPSVTPLFLPTVFVDIEDHLDVKVAAIAVHDDQRTKGYVRPEQVRGRASHRGGQARVRYAEGYEPVRLLGSASVAL